MVFWWRIWDGLIAEYWDGARRLIVEDLGGDLGLAIRLGPEQHRLLIAMDHALIEMLWEDDQLMDLSSALRDLLIGVTTNDKPQFYGYWRLPNELQKRRRLWLGSPEGSTVTPNLYREGES